jgi:hypothetical protein
MQKSSPQVAKRVGSIPGKLFESKELLVLKLIIQAYRKICEEKRFPRKRHEEWFSAILKGCIEELCLEYSKATGHHWHVTREDLNDNEQIRMGQVDPRNAPRIDITVICWKGLGGSRTKFPFENKRIIDNDTELIRAYIKDGLIDRYLNQEKDYSAGQPWGGMIGYILQGLHTTIVDKLNKQIDAQCKSPSEYLLIDPPIEGFDAVYKSQHQHPNGTDTLTIKHLFLTFLPEDEVTNKGSENAGNATIANN